MAATCELLTSKANSAGRRIGVGESFVAIRTFGRSRAIEAPPRIGAIFLLLAAATSVRAQQPVDGLQARLDSLEAEIQRAEDVSAIKRLQRTYGYYVDKGMWADLAEFFADDAARRIV